LGRGSGEVEGGQKWCQRILEELPSALYHRVKMAVLSHLLEYAWWGNGAGELGESVYGLKADFKP